MSSISSLFQPTQPATIERKDSGIAGAVEQLNNFKGFGGDTVEVEAAPITTIPATITFTPSNGSTCLSLYPRTKTFTYISTISDISCLASTPENQSWRITQSAGECSERFTFERLNEADETVELFRNCAVKIGSPALRRGSSADFGRKLSVGHFNSGLAGSMLPLSPVA